MTMIIPCTNYIIIKKEIDLFIQSCLGTFWPTPPHHLWSWFLVLNHFQKALLHLLGCKLQFSIAFEPQMYIHLEVIKHILIISLCMFRTSINKKIILCTLCNKCIIGLSTILWAVPILRCVIIFLLLHYDLPIILPYGFYPHQQKEK